MTAPNLPVPSLHNPSPLTLRYTFTCTPPSDISTTFFTTTGIPHVNCFLSGKYVVVRLSDNEYLSRHTDSNITQKLKSNGFHLVESMPARAARTLMAFRVSPSIVAHPSQVILEEVARRNDVHVDEIFILRNLKSPAIKIRLSTLAEADKLLAKGIRAFSIIIPTYNIEKERYQPIRQCFKCYKFDHSTPQCPSTSAVCSKCSTRGHTHTACSAQTFTCINCSGPHTAISFACPVKKQAVKDQHPSSTHAAPTTSLPTPSLQTTSYAQAAKAQLPVPTSTPCLSSVSSPDSSTICAKVQACASAASFYSNGDPTKFSQLFPLILQGNGLPQIKIPQSVISSSSQLTPEVLPTPNTASSHTAKSTQKPAKKSAPSAHTSETSSATPLDSTNASKITEATQPQETPLSKPTVTSCLPKTSNFSQLFPQIKIPQSIISSFSQLTPEVLPTPNTANASKISEPTQPQETPLSKPTVTSCLPKTSPSPASSSPSSYPSVSSVEVTDVSDTDSDPGDLPANSPLSPKSHTPITKRTRSQVKTHQHK